MSAATHPLLLPVVRWTWRRKELVLEAVVNGDITPVDVEKAHGISPAELDEWALAYITSDFEGLMATKRAARS